MRKNESTRIDKLDSQQESSNTVFYSLLCKSQSLVKYNLSKRSHLYSRLLKIQVQGFENKNDFYYNISYEFSGQPYWVTLDNLKKFIINPPVEEEDANRNCPLLYEGFYEIDLNDFIPVKITYSTIKTKGSKSVNTLQLNKNHPKYDSNTNNIVSYYDGIFSKNENEDDELVNDDEYADYIFPSRKLCVVKENKLIMDFPFYIGSIKTLKEDFWENEEEFPQDSMDKIKLFLTIEPLIKEVMLENKKLKEEDRDLWYKNTANRPSRRPEDEPSVTWMEYFDLMDDYKN